MKFVKLIFVFALLFLLSINTITVKSEDLPDCNVVITTDKLKINPSETLTFSIYLIGGGKVKTGYLNGLSDFSSKISSFQVIKPNEETETLDMSGQNVTYFVMYNVKPRSTIVPYISGMAYPESFNDTWDYFYYEIKVDIDENVNPGNHELAMSYVYQDTEDNWHVSSKTIQFYVNTPEEQNAGLNFVLGSILIPIVTTIVGAFLGFLGAFYLSNKWKRKRSEKNNQSILLKVNNKEKSKPSDTQRKRKKTDK